MRYAFGPKLGYARAAAPAPAAKADVAVGFPEIARTADGDFARVVIPAYDAADHNWLQVVRAYLVPDGQAFATADELVAGAAPYAEANVSHVLGGGEAKVRLPEVEVGAEFECQIVLGFDA